MNRSFFLLLLLLVLFGCARRGTITGGAKDTIPPVMIKARPKIETTNFNQEKIRIYFDEYIKIKDLKKNLIISPPQKYDPEISPLGSASKVITIKILDTLKPNTTYAFNFGNSIVDNNEGNELGNFKYVFSTGSHIDSLSVSGKVVDPQVGDKLKRIEVALYRYDSIFTDSIIYKKRPDYITNTLDSIFFNLTNLRAGKYLMIALNDKNGNKTYEPKSDKIGFVNDTVSIPTEKEFTISIFKEVPKFKVFRPREATKGHLIFGYEGDASGAKIKLKTKIPDSINQKIVFEKNKDTIHYWYTPFEVDSLNFEVSKGDYIEEFTAKMRTSKKDSLKISPEVTGNLHLLDTFSLNANIPIMEQDSLKIKVTANDSIATAFKSCLSKDSTKLYVYFKKEYKFSYRIDVLPNAITDVFNTSNDSLNYKVQTLSPEEYVVVAKFTPKGDEKIPLIVELIKNKKVFRTAYTTTDESVEFRLLPPGKYTVRVILDKNGNRRWDTGDFLNRIQPEVIKTYTEELDLKAGWEYLDNILLLD